MAWIRREPSGNWAATVYTPAGRRRRTFRLEGQAEAWARKQEHQIADADWIDPKAGRTTVGEIWDRYAAGRRLRLASRRRDESHWRVHTGPRWHGVPVGSVLKPDVDGWVTQMDDAGVGAASIEAAVGVLRAMLDIAVDARLIRVNPATKVRTPERPAHLDRVLEDWEDELLLDNLDRLFPGRADARLFVETLLYCGHRWEESAAIDRDHVDMRRKGFNIGPVMERDGTIRPFPKTPAGVRFTPVDDEMWPHVRDLAMATKPGGLLFTTAEGKPLHYPNWRVRVWLPALAERVAMDADEIEAYKAAQKAAGKRSAYRPEYYREVPLLADPQPTPHDLRHTYGTRLGEDGMPPHEIMALMGHGTLRSVQRYLHAREGRFDRARRAARPPRRSSR